MPQIPDEYIDLFERETFANFATKMPEGTPHVTPVWIDHDDNIIEVNSAQGRQKVKNVKRDPQVGICIIDPEDPYRYISILGKVIEITEQGAVDHINKLARRYMDVEEYPNLDDEEGNRVRLRIEPYRVIS
ncbi:MAG: PPOX class F420-dependent oxidoreductase [Halobacteriaceae archaeon]